MIGSRRWRKPKTSNVAFGILTASIFFGIWTHPFRYNEIDKNGRGLGIFTANHDRLSLSLQSSSDSRQSIRRVIDPASYLSTNTTDIQSITGNTLVVPAFDKEKIQQEQQWKDESLWISVSRKQYQAAVHNAHRAFDPLLDQVNTDCKMIVSPTSLDEIPSNHRTLVHFECKKQMKNEPCTANANLCLVVLANSKDGNYQFSASKTALLMLVDSMDYLLSKNDFAWKSFLNKAAYAYQSKRPFFMWIGHLGDEKNVLHGRENEAVYDAFGAACDPDFRPKQNSLHYYKSIAIAALFRKQTLVPSFPTAFFLDADISFSDEAFLRMPRSFKNESYNSDTFGPEDYFEISPQASLWGSQNTNGYIVMNGGLLGLRNTTWTHDFSALWWFTRCGHKDQRGLWLVLFATWSAATATTTSDFRTIPKDTQDEVRQFSYPGILFLTYNFGFSVALTHLRTNVKRIQDTWQIIASEQKPKTSKNAEKERGSVSQFEIPVPTNTSEFDGGNWEVRFKKPLELPHVLLLPLTSHVHHKSDGRTIDLPGLKADILDKQRDPFVVHSKSFDGVCKNKKCWPFVVESSTKRRDTTHS